MLVREHAGDAAAASGKADDRLSALPGFMDSFERTELKGHVVPITIGWRGLASKPVKVETSREGWSHGPAFSAYRNGLQDQLGNILRQRIINF